MLSKSTVFDCSVIDLDRIHSPQGNITILENHKNLPFAIKRVYYLYDVPGGETRGGHAHYELEQYIIAASGSFDVVLDDGTNRKRIGLNRPNIALHIVPGLWRELENFSSGSISLVMASDVYKAEDYIRDYNRFLKLKK
jgi:hypothetical protein